MVTTQSIRAFAADCLVWAMDTPDASNRQTIVTTARAWASIADALDRRDNTLPDLRRKLN